MRWLSSRMRVASRLRGERGGVAVIAAVLFSGMAIIGMLAVSVDLGNLTYERRQLQNGADSTSLALAQECAADPTRCDPGEVEELLPSNARDNAMQYDSRADAGNGACGRGDTTQVGSLPKCASTDSDVDITELGECPAIPQWLKDAPTIPYVETYSRTETTTGDDALFLPFSRVLAGGPDGDRGTTACARAAWGVPTGFARALPLTFSSCEWKRQIDPPGGGYVTEGPVGATSTNPGYGGTGQPAWPSASQEVVIMMHDPNNEDRDCGWNGKDTSGGFGWLAPASGKCEVDLKPDDWAQIKPGASIPSECGTALPQIRHRVIDLPVFDCIVGSASAPTGPPPTTPADVCDPKSSLAGGSKSWYHLAGWAQFYISGYRLTGTDSGTSSRPGGKSCSGGDRCLIGWFMTGTLSDAPSIAAPGSGNDFGVNVIKPAG